MNLLQEADVRATTAQLNQIADARASAAKVMAKWNAIRTTDVAAMNAKLRSAGLQPLASSP
jgi:hypothetical protein